MLRHADDQLSIGLILCKAKNRILAGYALRNTTTPMGIAEFRHLEELPKRLKGTLPTIEEIEAWLAKPQDPPRGAVQSARPLGARKPAVRRPPVSSVSGGS